MHITQPARCLAAVTIIVVGPLARMTSCKWDMSIPCSCLSTPKARCTEGETGAATAPLSAAVATSAGTHEARQHSHLLFLFEFFETNHTRVYLFSLPPSSLAAVLGGFTLHLTIGYAASIFLICSFVGRGAGAPSAIIGSPCSYCSYP